MTLEPSRGPLAPSCATALDRTFREKDESDYNPMVIQAAEEEFCSKKRTKSKGLRLFGSFGNVDEVNIDRFVSHVCGDVRSDIPIERRW